MVLRCAHNTKRKSIFKNGGLFQLENYEYVPKVASAEVHKVPPQVQTRLREETEHQFHFTNVK